MNTIPASALMDQSATFARLFARLVWLLLRESTDVAEQKVTLRALVTVSRAGAVRLEMRQGTIAANDEPLPALLPGVAELREQMTTQGVRAVEADSNATPADVLGAARRLAGAASATTGSTVRLVSATPAAAVAAQEAPERAPEPAPEVAPELVTEPAPELAEEPDPQPAPPPAPPFRFP